MNGFRCLVIFGFSAAAAWAQCPAPNFQRAGQAVLADPTSTAFLQRQTDGSFTRQRYQYTSPSTRLDTVGGYQPYLVECTAAGPRDFRVPAGWQPMADRPGTSSTPVIFTDLTGTGTPSCVGTRQTCLTGDPAGDKIVVALFAADGAIRNLSSFPVPGVVGALAADFNKDGRKDVAVVGSAGVSVLLGNGDGTLKPPVPYGANQRPLSAVALDLNGDNFADLAVLNGNSADVSVLLNKGDGTFKAAANFAVATSPLSIAVGDFNGDSRPDILAGAFQAISMLAGNGDGTFKTAVGLPIQFAPRQMAAGDFNKDGRLDLAAVDLATVIVLTGNGSGGFAPENDYAIDTSAGGSHPAGLQVMDLDGDGNLDAVLAIGHPDALMPVAPATAVVALFGRGDGTLIGPPSYPAGNVPASIGVADFNGDGKPDLAVSSVNSGDYRILLSLGNGNFQRPAVMTIQGPFGPISPSGLVARDLNGDGKQDLAVSDFTGDSLYVQLGQGNGSFQAPVRYAIGGLGTAVAAADFNGDGRLDLVAAGPPLSGTTGVFGLLLGNGDGTFQPIRTFGGAGSNPAALEVADFNKDGRPDVALLNFGSPGLPSDPGGVLLYLNSGNGTFQGPTGHQVGFNPTALAAGDLNGDGAPDLAVTTTGPNFSASFAAILLNSGNGGLGAPSMITGAFGIRSVAIGDVNLDGIPDLAVGHCCSETHGAFFLGLGNGSFAAETQFDPSVAPYTVALADLNGDSKVDLIAGTLLTGSGTFNSTIQVFANTSGSVAPPPPPPATGANPASGTTASQTISFTFTDIAGYQNFQVVNVLINSSLDGRSACYIAFVPSSATGGSLYLVNNAGDAGGPYHGLVLPGGGTVSNGQCTINGTGSSVASSGNTLTLTLAMTFSASFGGNRILYLSSQGKNGSSAGWQALGTWAVPGAAPANGPGVGGASPARTTSAANTFTFTFTDTNGFPDLAVANILINHAIDGRQACFVAFVPSSATAGSVYLVNDAGEAGGPYAGLVLPGGGTVGNSQCTISGAGSSVSAAGNTLTLTLAITFSQSFAGNRVLFVAARSNTLSSGWQAAGTVSVP